MRQGIHEDALRAMRGDGTVREVLVSRHGDKWSLVIRQGDADSRWLPGPRDSHTICVTLNDGQPLSGDVGDFGLTFSRP